jgi:hypothetical protein
MCPRTHKQAVSLQQSISPQTTHNKIKTKLKKLKGGRANVLGFTAALPNLANVLAFALERRERATLLSSVVRVFS